MKKTIAFFLALFLACSVGLALAEENITGLWYMDLGGAAAVLSLNADGSYCLSVPLEEDRQGTWELSDGFVYLDGAATPDLATWGENTLMLGDSDFFTREKPWTYVPAAVNGNAQAEMLYGYWVCRYVDVQGSSLPAEYVYDRTDLYIEGQSAILGGPAFGDTQVKLSFADGAMQCDNAGMHVTLQLQQDTFLRMTVAGADTAPQVFYLLRVDTPEEKP